LRAINRRRTAAAVLAIAVHFGFLLLLLGRPPDPVLSSDTAMQVSLVPAVAKPRPPAHPAFAPRAPPILHRPAQAPPPQPDAPPVSAAPAGRPETSPPGPGLKDAGAATLQRALRGRLGCTNRDLAALTDAERDACDELVGRDAANAPAYAVISPKLKKIFDGTFECKPDDEWCLYRLGKGPYPGLRGMARKKKKSDWDN
jgi:hypothetical protein